MNNREKMAKAMEHLACLGDRLFNITLFHDKVGNKDLIEDQMELRKIMNLLQTKMEEFETKLKTRVSDNRCKHDVHGTDCFECYNHEGRAKENIISKMS